MRASRKRAQRVDMCELTVRIGRSRYVGGLHAEKIEKVAHNGDLEEVGPASENRVVMFVSALSLDGTQGGCMG